MPQNLGARGPCRHLGGEDFHHGLLALLYAGGCASRDYMFSVTGSVRDANGKARQRARITLTTDDAVYDAITPIRSHTLEADAAGGFQFVYITHKRPTRYVLLVEEQGCSSKQVSGGAPPNQDHSITLDCHAKSGALPDR